MRFTESRDSIEKSLSDGHRKLSTHPRSTPKPIHKKCHAHARDPRRAASSHSSA